MKERVFLAVAVVALFGGLGVWAVVARRDRPPTAAAATLPPPSIGEPVAGNDERAVAERRVLESALLAGVPMVQVAARDGAPIFAVVLPGRDVFAVWERVQRASAESGRWPVVLGDGWAVRAHADATLSTDDRPQAIVARARALDVDAWVASRLERDRPREGQWPADGAEVASARPPRDWIDAPLRDVAISLLPTSDPSETPAWLAFGNWAGCPEPTVHVAMLSRWRERFGAEVVSIGLDEMELRVTRPPSDREVATQLAREQIAYAPSLVAGGTRSVAEIAASRIGATSWSFRWPRTTAPR